MATELGIEAVFYDVQYDSIFYGWIRINDLEITYHDNGIGFKKLKYSGSLTNDYKYAILLGTL